MFGTGGSLNPWLIFTLQCVGGQFTAVPPVNYKVVVQTMNCQRFVDGGPPLEVNMSVTKFSDTNWSSPILLILLVSTRSYLASRIAKWTYIIKGFFFEFSNIFIVSKLKQCFNRTSLVIKYAFIGYYSNVSG